MSQEEFPREDELESRQAAALYPVGRVLRATYDAENHDSLGNDLTGLMIELSHIDPDAAPLTRHALQPVAAAPVVAAPAASTAIAAPPPAPWWRRVLDGLLGR